MLLVYQSKLRYDSTSMMVVKTESKCRQHMVRNKIVQKWIQFHFCSVWFGKPKKLCLVLLYLRKIIRSVYSSRFELDSFWNWTIGAVVLSRHLILHKSSFTNRQITVMEGPQVRVISRAEVWTKSVYAWLTAVRIPSFTQGRQIIRPNLHSGSTSFEFRYYWGMPVEHMLHHIRNLNPSLSNWKACMLPPCH